jgi:hypothetical protein
MARAQSLFFELQGRGRIHSFGGIPGYSQPYGFGGVTTRGAAYVVMNPAQSMATLTLPKLDPSQLPLGTGRVQFRDAGFIPQLNRNKITLGPGQMAMVGYGAYAAPAYNFGVQDDVVIPTSIEPIDADFRSTAPGSIEAAIQSPAKGSVRIIMRQSSPDGTTFRTHGGSPPDGENMAKVFTIQASQDGRDLPVTVDYNKIVWSGLSWAAGEIKASDFDPAKPITIRIHSAEKDPVKLEGAVYRVVY